MKQKVKHHIYIIYTLFCVIFGVFAIMGDLGNTGRLLLLTAIYLSITQLFLKVKALQKRNSWLKHHSIIGRILFTLVCVSGIIESFLNNKLLMLLFAEILVFFYVFVYFNFRNKNGVSILKKWGIMRFLFRMFFIVATVFLIISVLFQYQPLGEIFDPYYFILLFVFLLEVLISHLYQTLQLKQEQTQSELLLLRSQLNPHFFFNTLNNLYTLTLKNSKQAPEVILKLSEMMRYTIYEGEKRKVPLKEEIIYLENYIDLHKIRYKKTVIIAFHHSVNETLMVTPLLFINLLENAFKHGVDSVSENAHIKINLRNDDDFIYFSVENNFEDTTEIKEKGIGLKNLQRRLILLYPKTHQLEFSKKNNIFKVNLKIPI